MIVSKGFDSLRVKQTPDVSIAKNHLDDSFTAKLLYSASYNDLDNNQTILKKSPNGYLQHQRTSVPAEYQSVPQKTHQKGSNAPKVSQRLPSPFGSTFQKSPLPPKKYLLCLIFLTRLRNIFVKPLLTEGGLFDAIDNMVHMHEYKNAQELLSPLKKRRVPRETEESDPFTSKKANGRKGKNPLIPLKNYMLMTKMNEALYKSDDIFKQKLDKVYKTHQGNHSFLPKPVQQENLRLNEMITLGPIKPSTGTGIIRKMIHAPTLKLYTEVPINNRESRQNLKIWLEEWQSALQGSKYNLKVFNTFFNSPEGCLSIVTEFMGTGSLQNLLDSLINIPEKSLKIIALQTLLGLSEVHDHMKTSFGALSPTQLSLGLRGRISATGHSQQRGKSLSDKALFHGQSPGDLGSLLSKKGKPHDLSLISDNKLREGISQDVFDFGYLMLTCALGGLELFDTDGFVSKLRALLAEIEKKPQERNKYCCLIHNQELISSVVLQNADEDIFLNKPVKVQRNNTITFEKSPKKQTILSIKDFLTCNNYSKDFIDFLCSCLKFDPNKRGSLRSLFTSRFLQDSHSRGPNTSIHDLIKISTQWNHNNPLRPEIQGPSEGQLKKLCDALAMVLPNCHQTSQDPKSNKLEILKKLNSKSHRIRSLSSELGLPASKVWESISKVLDSVTFTEKSKT